MNKCTLEEQINRTGKLLQTTVGSSMEPMLKNRQNVVAFEKPTEILKNMIYLFINVQMESMYYIAYLKLEKMIILFVVIIVAKKR